jgi:hypothetical protein
VPLLYNNLRVDLSSLDPHVINSLAIICNSLVSIHGVFEHDGNDDMMDDNGGHRGAMAMEPIVMQKTILFTV